MSGPFELSAENLRDLGEAYGTYIVLGEGSDRRESLIVCYVGRGNLKQRLSAHAKKTNYVAFCYRRLRSEDRAFQMECELFHKYDKAPHLDNRIHPALPEGSAMPVCTEWGCNGEAD